MAAAMLTLAGVLAWKPRREPLGLLVLAAAASALGYAAGFVFLAPGAELRYLTWPIVLAPLALAMSLLGRRWPPAAAAESRSMAATPS